MPKKKSPPTGKKRGPKPERLKIEGDWKDAVKAALKRGKPSNNRVGGGVVPEQRDADGRITEYKRVTE